MSETRLPGEPQVSINGDSYPIDVEPRVSLLDFIREQAGLTGCHAGCEQGSCGACSVFLDGRLVRSCLVLAVATAGRRVTTIEGVGSAGNLHPVQTALLAHHGLQCGYCTPGVVLTAIDLLERVPAPDEAQVRDALSGNLCRCTGYAGMTAAIVEVGQQARGQGQR